MTNTFPHWLLPFWILLAPALLLLLDHMLTDKTPHTTVAPPAAHLPGTTPMDR